MTELLPGVQAPAIRDSILDYLGTTFALSDEDARVALLDFLANRDNGIFKGPYLRVRLPFRPAEESWRKSLEWYEGPTPYGHQATAFARLSSLDVGRAKPRPLPTLVTTGTGSGKTEAFLYPIIDHVLRARRRGITGMKALILYPMNALANDQAQRLAGLLVAHAELSGVTAAIYTGEKGSQRTKVSAAGLITDRTVIRSSPPDILLTNYKMLDQLLLRPADAGLWQKSATSLQYLVLDEFHTYDGAQGTDVSMLLRRLGLALKSHWSPDGKFTDADRARPLGVVTPVATSATLGDKGDPAAMLDFAETVFGEEFGIDAVVTESRMSVDEWARDGVDIPPSGGVYQPRTDREAILEVIRAASPEADGRRIAEKVLASLYVDDQGRCPELAGATPVELLVLAKRHPFTAALVSAASQAQALADLVDIVLPSLALDEGSRQSAEEFLLLFSAMLSHIRKTAGRSALSIDLHLWIRELTRIDRVAIGTPQYLWSDDRHLSDGGPDSEVKGGPAFPAVYCRHCGRSGWAVVRAPIGGFDLAAAEAADIRLARATNDQEFRVLIHAPSEAEASLDDQHPSVIDADEGRLLWFHPTERRVIDVQAVADAAGEAEVAAGRVLPVLAHTGPRAGRFATEDTCPACMQKDGIRFLGSAIATLLSVSLSTLFGSEELDKVEKKALIFTDSVQDAAHRAGFVQSRSHTLTLRSVLRAAVEDDLVSLDLLVDRVLQQAGDDPHRRYRLLPPDLADRKEFMDFWRRDRQRQVPPSVRRRVKRRLLLDTVLEFGLLSRLGRTLELTGSLSAEVDASPEILLKAATLAEKAVGVQRLAGMGISNAQRVAWVRGVLERMRTDGAIAHEWFSRYQSEDGNRYSIWGGRPRSDGMPAFPRGRGAPAYPRIGGGRAGRDSDLVQVASSQSWYALWTARTLQFTASEGAVLAVQLLTQLVALDILRVVNTPSGGQVFELPQNRILIGPVPDDGYSWGRYQLACSVCGSVVPGSEQVVDELRSMPCFVARCTGRLGPRPGRPENFYRRLYASTDVARVIAREHTGLLPDELRLQYENQFKTSDTDPQAPNVLVATPTLEMGIDIGDLSTVILASLPRSVASYLQRVGRAGRLTGSALDLAFVSGRGEQLPRLGDPLSVINGEVRPPATYLDAEEILRRQYLASVVDGLARRADAPHPTTPTQAIGSTDEGSFLHAVILTGESNRSIDGFLSGFDSLGEEARTRLKQWATPESGRPLTSQLSLYLHEQRHRWNGRVDLLTHRIAEIQSELPELQQRAELPAATDDDRIAFRTATAALKLARRDLHDLRDGYWVAVLEEHGILPNYTLLDDSVTLDVTLSWIDPDTQEYLTEPASFNRGAALALREFAPGATFYARGHKITVDAVDLGSEGDAIRTWVFCPACGFAQLLGSAPPSSCPRCGSPDIADVQRRLDVVELERVSSAMRREEAAIDDGRDERERTLFQISVAADVGPPRHQWFVDGYAFGLKHLTDVTIRWLNLGKRADPAAGTRTIAGEEVSAPLFRVCTGCGKLDSRTGANSASEHRPWCVYRNATAESVRNIALSRTLTTEAVVIQLPASISVGDRYAMPSLMAALQLGLREHLGGAPDHLAIEQIVDPHLSDGLDNRDALLLHDTVPGGTGYLAELADPQRFYAVIHRAWQVVRDCPCQGEHRAACHRCLSPFISGAQQRFVSRLAAERYLKLILLSGQTEGEPTPETGWVITEQQTAVHDPETQIEQLFRQVLLHRLTNGLGASVHEQPGPYGNRWTINPGGGRIWTMDPQLPLGGVQPDFVFASTDSNVPRLAVFCDGWKFHASPAVNNMAADAQKRAGLRMQGTVVVALTWQDLVADGPAGGAPPWFSETGWQRVMSAMPGLRPGLRDLVVGSPVDFIVSWVSNPDPAGIAALADALPLLLAGAGAHGKLPAALPLDLAARDLHDGLPLAAAGERTAWAWQSDTLTVLARQATAQSPAASEVAVLLDDRAAQLGQHHKGAWREWLRLANLLNLRHQNAYITAYSEVGAATPSVADPETVVAELAEPWAILHDQAVGSEKPLIELFARAGLIVPVLGHETEDGLPLDISWPDRKVAVDLDLDAADRDELSANGWVIVPADLVAIREALDRAGVS